MPHTYGRSLPESVRLMRRGLVYGTIVTDTLKAVGLVKNRYAESIRLRQYLLPRHSDIFVTNAGLISVKVLKKRGFDQQGIIEASFGFISFRKTEKVVVVIDITMV